MTEPMRYRRRELIEMVLGSSVLGSLLATGVGCEYLDSFTPGRLPPRGELLSPNQEVGHRLRDGAQAGESSRRGKSSGSDVVAEKQTCVIVGGGIAGLSAAWHLAAAGVDDFTVLELETVPGGTSRGGVSEGFSYPWGAHYLPVPMAENRPLVDFLLQCGVLQGETDGSWLVAEQVLCRDPEERIFVGGRWHQGLYPGTIAKPEDFRQLDRFRNEMIRLANLRGEDARRWFTIPMSRCSNDPLARQFDQMSMSDWMDEQGFDSTPLRWLVDYACRDDYGLHPEQTSAWAGLFYFAARIADASGQSQPVMTWPQGNGYLVDRLLEPLGDRVRLGQAVMRMTPMDRSTESGAWLLDVLDCQSETFSRMQAERVVLAVPQFIASRMMDRQWTQTFRPDAPLVSSYGSWLVANVHLSDRPDETGFPMAWDNVTMTSSSLGYVNSVHQTGRDHGATVLTWYQALPSDVPQTVREKLMQLTWAEAAETVIVDLEIAHPWIRSLITRLDIMVWGHAMPEPRVGSIFHPARAAAKRARGNVHFACTDLSAMALFEEAFDHGHRAAMEVLSHLHKKPSE